MLVSEAERMKKQLEVDIKQLMTLFEEATSLIITSVYVNRMSVMDKKKQSILNSIECEVQLL